MDTTNSPSSGCSEAETGALGLLIAPYKAQMRSCEGCARDPRGGRRHSNTRGDAGICRVGALLGVEGRRRWTAGVQGQHELCRGVQQQGRDRLAGGRGSSDWWRAEAVASSGRTG